MLKVDGVKLPVDHSEDDLNGKLENLLRLTKYGRDGIMPGYSYTIIRKSLDARKKPDLFYVYSLAVALDKKVEEKILNHNKDRNISLYQPVVYKEPEETGDNILNGRPVIVGAGPAGLFCAYELSKMGYAPVIIERGEEADKRAESVRRFWVRGELKKDSNVQFGEGGAGTFSDGKLNTGVNDKKGRNQYVLNTLAGFGAPEEITYLAKPHIGTDILVRVVKNMREEIIKQGGEFMFETLMTDFEKDPDGTINVHVTKEGREETIKAGCLVLAIGHSARDTFRMLHDKGINMVQKAFAVGLRIQHPQDMINKSRYGTDDCKDLGPADYKLTYRTKKGRNVYSFCMCPGGYVVNASSETGRLAVNGMSYSDRNSKNANSAIIVSVDKHDFGSDHVLAGMEFQRKLEEKAYILGGGSIPIQEYKDFKKNQLSSGAGSVIPRIKGAYRLANLRELLPELLNEAIIESMEKFGYTIGGFDRDDAVLAGVESRTSSPVRILRNEEYEGSMEGLYPCGEGAGYAGGITSAAMDGIKVAEAIVGKYRPYSTTRNVRIS